MKVSNPFMLRQLGVPAAALQVHIEAALVLSWLSCSVGLVGATPSCRDVRQSLHFALCRTHPGTCEMIVHDVLKRWRGKRRTVIGLFNPSFLSEASVGFDVSQNILGCEIISMPKIMEKKNPLCNQCCVFITQNQIKLHFNRLYI